VLRVASCGNGCDGPLSRPEQSLFSVCPAVVSVNQAHRWPVQL